nr:MAG: RNA-dependent RNA polymerase [Owegonang virus 1]
MMSTTKGNSLDNATNMLVNLIQSLKTEDKVLLAQLLAEAIKADSPPLSPTPSVCSELSSPDSEPDRLSVDLTGFKFTPVTYKRPKSKTPPRAPSPKKVVPAKSPTSEPPRKDLPVFDVILTTKDLSLNRQIIGDKKIVVPKDKFQLGFAHLTDTCYVACIGKQAGDALRVKDVAAAVNNTLLQARRQLSKELRFVIQTTHEDDDALCIKTITKLCGKFNQQFFIAQKEFLPRDEHKIQTIPLDDSYPGRSIICHITDQNDQYGKFTRHVCKGIPVNKFLKKEKSLNSILVPYKLADGQYLYFTRFSFLEEKHEKSAFKVLGSHMNKNNVSKVVLCESDGIGPKYFLKALNSKKPIEVSEVKYETTLFMTQSQHVRHQAKLAKKTLPDEVTAPLNVYAVPCTKVEARLVSSHSIPLKGLFKITFENGLNFTKNKDFFKILDATPESFWRNNGVVQQHSMTLVPAKHLRVDVKGLSKVLTSESGRHTGEQVVYALLKNIRTMSDVLTISSLAASCEIMCDPTLDLLARKNAWLIVYTRFVRLLCHQKKIILPENIPKPPLPAVVAYYNEPEDFNSKLLDIENLEPTCDLTSLLSDSLTNVFNRVAEATHDGLFNFRGSNFDDLKELFDLRLIPYVLPYGTLMVPPQKKNVKLTFSRRKVKLGLSRKDLTLDNLKEIWEAKIKSSLVEFKAQASKALDPGAAAMYHVLDLFETSFLESGDLRSASDEMFNHADTVEKLEAVVFLANRIFADRQFHAINELRKDLYSNTQEFDFEQLLDFAFDNKHGIEKLGTCIADKSRPSFYKFFMIRRMFQVYKSLILESYIGQTAHTIYIGENTPQFIVLQYIEDMQKRTARTQNEWISSLRDTIMYPFSAAGAAFARGGIQEVATATSNNTVLSDVTDTIRQVREFVQNRPEYMSAREAVTGIDLTSVVSLLESALSSALFAGINKILTALSMDEVEPVHIPIGKIIAAYILYQRLYNIDIPTAVSLVYLALADTGIIKPLINFMKTLFEVVLSLIKKVTTCVVNFICKGCTYCTHLLPFGLGPQDEGPPAEAARTQSDEEDFQEVVSMEFTPNRTPANSPAPAEPAPQPMTCRGASEDSFERYMSGLSGSIPEPIPQAEPEPKPEVPTTDKSRLCWFFDQLERHSIAATGLLAVGLAATLGYVTQVDTDMIGSAGRSIIGMAKNIHWLTLGIAALPKVYSYGLIAIQWIQENYKLYRDPKMQSNKELCDEVELWLKNCSVIEHGVIETAFLRDHRVGLFFNKMYVQGLDLRPRIIGRLPLHLISLVNQTWKRLQETRPNMKTIEAFHTGIFEPIHFQFTGESGLGKTNIHQKLIPELARILEINDIPYPMNDDLAHFDSYLDQEVAVNDDMFVSRADQQIETKLKLLSGCPVVIPMARVDDKGCSPRFKLFVSNTNTPFPRVNEMNCLKAIWRRRHLIKVIGGQPPDPEVENTYLAKMRFTVLNEVVEAAGPKEPALMGLTWTQFLRWAKTITRKHKEIEDHRAQEYGKLDVRRKFERYTNIISDAMVDFPRRFGESVPEIISLFETYNCAGEVVADYVTPYINRNVEATQCEHCFSYTSTQDPMDVESEIIPTSLSVGITTFLNITGAYGASTNHRADFSQKMDSSAAITARLIPYPISPAMPACFGLTDDPDALQEDLFGGTVSRSTDHYGHTLDSDRLHVEMMSPVTGTPIDTPLFIRRVVYDVNGLDRNLLASPMFRMKITGLLLQMNNANTLQELRHAWEQSSNNSSIHQHVREALKRAKMNESVLQKFFRCFWTPTTKLYTEFMKLFPQLVGIISCVGALALIGAALVYDVRQELRYQEYLRHRRSVLGETQYTVDGRQRRIPFVNGFEEDLPEDSSYESQLTMLARRAACTLSFKHASKNSIYRSNMIAIRGNCFLINKHTADRMPKTGHFPVSVTSTVRIRGASDITFKTLKEEHYVKFSDVHYFPNYDAAILVIPTCRAMVDSIPQFVKEEDVKRELMCREPFMLLSLDKEAFTITRYPNLKSVGKTTLYDHDNKPYENLRAMQYNYDSYACVSGQSGSVALSLNRHLPRPFLGMHVGGTDTAGTIIPITQEMIRDLVSKIPVENFIAIKEPVCHMASEIPEDLEGVNIIGRATFSVPQPAQTKLVKTPIQSRKAFPILTQPAILSDKDPRWQQARIEDPTLPHYAAISNSKYEGPSPLIDYSRLSKAAVMKADYMIQHFAEVRIQTVDEAVLGSCHTGSKGMDRNTSPGLPYILKGSKKGKTEWYTPSYTSHSVALHPEVEADLKDFWMHLDNGAYPTRYKGVFLKDETLPNEKILKKTRVITMGDLVDHIVYGQIHGDYDRIAKNLPVHDTHIAIGINLESPDAHELIMGFEDTTQMYCFDVKNWDGSVSYPLRKAQAVYLSEIYQRAYDYRQEPYPIDFRTTFMAYMEGQTHANLVFRNLISRTQKGMKSGERGTTRENSEIQDLMAFTKYLELCERVPCLRPYASYEMFNTHVRRVFCGDDSAYSIQGIFRKYITPQEIATWYTDFGFKVTSAKKDESIRSVTLSEFQFLKHTFKYSLEHGRFIAIPDISIVYNLFNWQTTTLPCLDQFRVNCLAAMRFAYWHGPEEFERIRLLLNSACIAARVPVFNHSYSVIGSWIEGVHLTEDLSFGEQSALKETVEHTVTIPAS